MANKNSEVGALTRHDHRKLALDMDVVPGTLVYRGIHSNNTPEENRKAAVEYIEDLDALAAKSTAAADVMRAWLNGGKNE